MASRSKPKARAKVAGNPWSVTTSLGASDGRAFRANRSSQDRRQCARFALVKVGAICAGAGEASGEIAFATRTVWLRTTLSQERRMLQRGQSFHCTGVRGGGWDTASGGGEIEREEGSSGHNTALTRRGFCVVLLSWHCARKGQERQWPMRAAYKTRSEPSRSGRRSWG